MSGDAFTTQRIEWLRRDLASAVAEATALRATVARVRALCDERVAAKFPSVAFNGIPLPSRVSVDEILAALDSD